RAADLDERDLPLSQHPRPDLPVRRLRIVARLRHSGAARRACRTAHRDAAADGHHGIRHLDRAHRLLDRARILVAAALRALRLEGPSARAAAHDGWDVRAGRAGRLRRRDLDLAMQSERTDAADTDLARPRTDQAPGPAGDLSS